MVVRDPHSTDSWSLYRVCQAEPGIGGARLQVQLGCATRGQARRWQAAFQGWDSGDLFKPNLEFPCNGLTARMPQRCHNDVYRHAWIFLSIGSAEAWMGRASMYTNQLYLAFVCVRLLKVFCAMVTASAFGRV